MCNCDANVNIYCNIDYNTYCYTHGNGNRDTAQSTHHHRDTNYDRVANQYATNRHTFAG